MVFGTPVLTVRDNGGKFRGSTIQNVFRQLSARMHKRHVVRYFLGWQDASPSERSLSHPNAKFPPMQAYANIVANRDARMWTAWFKDEPAMKYSNESISVAIGRLVGDYGPDSFNFDRILLVSKGEDGNRLEFAVPLTGRIRIPVPSLN